MLHHTGVCVPGLHLNMWRVRSCKAMTRLCTVAAVLLSNWESKFDILLLLLLLMFLLSAVPG